MSAPRVTGGTYYGGTALQLLCPRTWQGEPCEAEFDAEFTNGHLTLAVQSCPWCDGVFTEEDRVALEKQVADAINNYDGPSDADLSDAVSDGERMEVAQRDRWRHGG